MEEYTEEYREKVEDDSRGTEPEEPEYDFHCPECGQGDEDPCSDDYKCPACGVSFVKCYDCGEWVRDTNVQETYRCRDICEGCAGDYYTCDGCGYLVTASRAESDSDYTYCPDCMDSRARCRSCGEIFDYEDLYDGYCENCRDDDGGGDYGDDRVYDSDYKPNRWTYHGGNREKDVFYGIELETDNYRNWGNAVDEIYALSEHETQHHMVQDSSLSQEGIEVVFHPRTLASWRKHAKEGLPEVLGAIKANGGCSFNANSSCGCHIHRSRRDLSEVDCAKLVIAMMRLEPWIKKVAQRNSTRYASFEFWRDYTGAEGPKVVYRILKNTDISRAYEKSIALNLRPRSTIEFRVFKGTLSIDSLLAYIEFTDAFVWWVKLIGITKLILSNEEDLWRAFVTVAEKRGYSALMKHLKAKGAMPKEVAEVVEVNGSQEEGTEQCA